MSSNASKRQMAEDRALRDAARALVEADLSHLKSDLSFKGIAPRLKDRMTEGAVDVFEEATEAAESNRGVLLTLLAAVAIWFARNPILELFSDLDQAEADGAEPETEDLN